MANNEVYSEPAKVSYFFDKGYRDLKNTIVDAWVRNIESAKEFFSEVPYAESKSGKAIKIVAALSIFVFGSILCVITSLLHILVLGVVFLAIYIGFSVVWLIDRLYIMKNKIRSACPNSDCQEDFLIPTYICECGAEHRKLVPSKYGILQRTCNCGRKLPTTFLNGREQLYSVCPVCGTEITKSKARQIAIPVIGGPSVGKTCFVNMAVNEMSTSIAPDAGWSFEFASEVDEQKFNAEMARLNAGTPPEKTAFTSLTAYKFILDNDNWSVPKRIYMYDIAGEMFSSSSDISANKAYSYSDGFIFIVDPLTIPRFAAERDDINVQDYGASSKDFNDILDLMLINLEKMYNLKPKDMLKTNVAVVINKCDIPGIDEIIGESAVSAYMEAHPEVASRNEARNAVCEAFFVEYEASNFIRTIKSKCRNVQFFTCSSLGHVQNGNKYISQGVDEPIMWLLKTIDADFR